jgi:hypothetical protein
MSQLKDRIFTERERRLLEGRTFTTERDRLSYLLTWANDDPEVEATAAPLAAGRDIGDEVADRMDAHLGRKPTAAVAPVTTSGPRDLGDEVADRMELSLYGAVRG